MLGKLGKTISAVALATWINQTATAQEISLPETIQWFQNSFQSCLDERGVTHISQVDHRTLEAFTKIPEENLEESLKKWQLILQSWHAQENNSIKKEEVLNMSEKEFIDYILLSTINIYNKICPLEGQKERSTFSSEEIERETNMTEIIIFIVMSLLISGLLYENLSPIIRRNKEEKNKEKEIEEYTKIKEETRKIIWFFINWCEVTEKDTEVLIESMSFSDMRILYLIGNLASKIKELNEIQDDSEKCMETLIYKKYLEGLLKQKIRIIEEGIEKWTTNDFENLRTGRTIAFMETLIEELERLTSFKELEKKAINKELKEIYKIGESFIKNDTKLDSEEEDEDEGEEAQKLTKEIYKIGQNLEKLLLLDFEFKPEYIIKNILLSVQEIEKVDQANRQATYNEWRTKLSDILENIFNEHWHSIDKEQAEMLKYIFTFLLNFYYETVNDRLNKPDNNLIVFIDEITELIKKYVLNTQRRSFIEAERLENEIISRVENFKNLDIKIGDFNIKEYMIKILQVILEINNNCDIYKRNKIIEEIKGDLKGVNSENWETQEDINIVYIIRKTTELIELCTDREELEEALTEN